uniref:V2 n=1 Tax=Turnip leaf roll virus TaxID=1766828 RepID=A0A0S3JNT4_9GEMI|nr:V2 [Turnip leaf roll virus]
MEWVVAYDKTPIIRAFSYKKRRFHSCSEYLLAPLLGLLRRRRTYPDWQFRLDELYTNDAYNFLCMLKEEKRTPYQILEDEYQLVWEKNEVAIRSRMGSDTKNSGEEAGDKEGSVSSPITVVCETSLEEDVY